MKQASTDRRCDELERKLRFILKEIESFGLPILGRNPVVDTASASPIHSVTAPRSSSALLDALESELEKYEGQLLELSNYSDELTSKYNEKIEFQECLEKGKFFFESETGAVGGLLSSAQSAAVVSEDGMQPLLGDDFAGLISAGGQRVNESDMKFSSTVGVLNADEKSRFERMLFRSTRGNCLSRFREVERPIADAASGKPEHKIVFIVFFKSEVIGAIIKKICGAFGARQYPVPDHTTLSDTTRLSTIIHETTAELTDAVMQRDITIESLC
jgi:V-type H+-transporting ATPase subunit a